ncbi:undecaprenyl-diphosphate phosphatase [Aquibacillus koreensis]|uniref:Undecaprenyl-diphosphatase n=1 Tax=Aquibacillus koreensis TaxID=279446 RepID=A0A9X3WK34_9BACI|nr:undecaprenyl-diphosphate phosphatase [Aquibacillus koreensis]MCT2535637.1 undecaprenyl-diphosphate phosphatase [Aquibacillus koreensis]MDC3420078.1 undecaprenyl-diphosphate phosphatase [Aquibacillus koreensis]
MDNIVELGLLIKYIFFGFVQGFTEPIPISSSGHLVIVQNLFDLKMDNLSFEILVNFGSLIAVLIIYRKDLLRLIQNGVSYITTKKPEAKDDFNFIFYLIVATVPAGVIGVLFEEQIGEIFDTNKIIGITLIVTGIALWIIRNLRGSKNDGALTLKDAVIVGLAQSVALIPGISRSGSTIVAAMLLGMKQETALRFSFLLFIPVSLGTLVLKVGDIVSDPDFNTMWIPYALAFITSIIATYYSLRWFMNIMARGNLKYFAFYCFIVGALAYLLL